MIEYWASVDLGKLTNPSALAVIEREPFIDGSGNPLKTTTGGVRCKWSVVGLRRFPLGHPYEQVANELGDVLRRSELPKCKLVVDVTGVGVAVLEMIDKAVPRGSIVYPVMITGGSSITMNGRRINVPKAFLAGSIRSGLETGDLRISRNLEHAELLKKELLNFEMKFTRTATLSFEASPGEYDDLVIATSMPGVVATWLEGQPIYIAGAPSEIIPGAKNRAKDALLQGGRITFDRDRERDREANDRRGWQPGMPVPMPAPHSSPGGPGIFGDPGDHR